MERKGHGLTSSLSNSFSPPYYPQQHRQQQQQYPQPSVTSNTTRPFYPQQSTSFAVPPPPPASPFLYPPSPYQAHQQQQLSWPQGGYLGPAADETEFIQPSSASSSLSTTFSSSLYPIDTNKLVALQQQQQQQQKRDIAAIVVDGSYSFKMCSERGKRMNFQKMIDKLEAQFHCTIARRIYVDYIPDPNKPFYRYLKEVKFEPVSCQIKNETRYDRSKLQTFQCTVQKGGDVMVAYYLMRWAFENDFRRIFVMAGDGDFYPVLRFIADERRNQKDLTLLHWSESISDTLFPFAQKRIEIDTDPNYNGQDGIFLNLSNTNAIQNGAAEISATVPDLPDVLFDSTQTCSTNTASFSFSSLNTASPAIAIRNQHQQQQPSNVGIVRKSPIEVMDNNNNNNNSESNDRTIYVGNMPLQFPTEQSIRTLFQNCEALADGSSLSIEAVSLHQLANRPFKYAKVRFATLEQARHAILCRNNFRVGGRHLRVEFVSALNRLGGASDAHFVQSLSPPPQPPPQQEYSGSSISTNKPFSNNNKDTENQIWLCFSNMAWHGIDPESRLRMVFVEEMTRVGWMSDVLEFRIQIPLHPTSETTTSIFVRVANEKTATAMERVLSRIYFEDTDDEPVFVKRVQDDSVVFLK